MTCQVEIQASLRVHQCSCGGIYATLFGCEVECPYCSHRKIDQLRKVIDRNCRSISSLRGVVSRQKGRK